ncbi:hypothetical protein F4804DRAFT_303804 [Jackrogersella minutella]|nr:hypothetical protein F4804DRAFT_303804 [Jackrogersella minutella]
MSLPATTPLFSPGKLGPTRGTTQPPGQNSTKSTNRAAYYPSEADVREYPKGIFEFLFTATFGDPDRRWGPFYKHIRAARKEGRWREWSIRDIADAVPDDLSDDLNLRESEISSRRNRRSQSISGSRYRLAEELRRDVRPAHIDFEELLERDVHPGDYDDEFYKSHYSNLYNNTVTFATKWFDGNVNLENIQESGQGLNHIWTTPLTEQFLEYARLVAHEDYETGSWPIILNDGTQRRWLIVGILGQIMEKKIFNELLFGADDDIQDELERLDSKWIEKEGYGRKAVRAITARYGVEGRLLPRKFWPTVDDLAAKTVRIFLPLLNIFKEVFPGNSKVDYTQEIFLQELHALLSYAGMIQVCMAVSPSIFHFLSATPGARMDYSLESQSDMGLYRQSKEYYEEQEKHWKEYVNATMEGRMVQNRTGRNIRVPQNAIEKRTMEYHRMRGAKVKFAVFPKVTRYKPENLGKGVEGVEILDDKDAIFEDDQKTIEGQSVIDISNTMVVYYQGLIYPEEGLIEALTLDQHLDMLFIKPNGLVGLFGKLFWALFSAIRKVFWHVLVIGGFITLVYSAVAGTDFLKYLLANWFILIFFIGYCLYHLASISSRKGELLSAWSVVVIPLILLYFIGFAFIFAQNEAAKNDPTTPWKFNGTPIVAKQLQKLLRESRV